MTDDLDEEDSLLGVDALSFVDFLFGLVAVMILALSLASSGQHETTQKLRSGSLTRDFILEVLRCGLDDESIKKDCDSVLGDFEIKRPPGEAVLVAEYTKKDGPGMFSSGKSFLNTHTGVDELLKEIRTRIEQVLPCFAPRHPKALVDVAEDCTPIYVAAERFMSPGSSEKERDIVTSKFATVELFVIEGHSDGLELGGNQSLPEDRAKRVLRYLITGEDDGNKSTAIKVSQALDDLAPKGAAFDSALMSTVPIRQRLVEVCLGAESGEGITVREWCSRLLDGASRSDAVQGTYYSRIFALSSFGRYSLRYGKRFLKEGEGQGDPKDRRIELRLVMSSLPQGIYELQQAHSDKAYFALFSAAAVAALQQCDNDSGDDKGSVDCLTALNQVIDGSDG